MKKYILFLAGILFSASLAWAQEADLEGRITRIDYTKNTILVLNELKNNIGLRDYRVIVKQGMINDYKRNDRLKIWLMSDLREAEMIELVSH